MAKYNAKHIDKYEEIIINKCGLVTHVAKAMKVAPKTIYSWKKEYPDFNEIFDRAIEAQLDKAESKLFQNIDEGKETSLIFYLKCIGKKRGYIDKEIIMQPNFSMTDLKLMYEQMTGSTVVEPEEVRH